MGIVKAVCISGEKGGKKTNVNECQITLQGLKDDAHAGDWHRQISLLSYEKITAFFDRHCPQDAPVSYGAFGENIVAEGIDFAQLPPGTNLRCGKALLEITQIGKECHSRCTIYERMGDCIMPREGIFARVLEPGIVKSGDKIHVE